MRRPPSPVRGLLSAAFAMSVLAAALAPAPAGATHDSIECGDITIVFARGSGQALNDREAPKFLGDLADRLGGLTVNGYELGTEPHGGAGYPAVGIGADSLQSFKNLIEADASWTGGAGGQYRQSVADGVTELSSYLDSRSSRCPDEQFVIGGYSQGAQVVGDALAAVGSGLRNKVAFVALFGDPKLYLPEGRGPFPPACRGDEFSKWRRGNVSCFTDGGILEARKPYMPGDIEDRVGSWCDRNDPICNNNLADFAVSAHSYYAEDGAEMDEAVREAAIAVKDRVPPDRGAGIDTSYVVFAVGTAGVDVSFVIDTTGSMGPYIAAAKSTANSLAAAITALRGRVSLTEYRDSGDVFVSRVVTPLTDDIDAFRSGVDNLEVGGGGDTPEALLAALMDTMRTLDWTPGATKAAVVLTDAGYHDPDVATGDTLTDVAALALSIDPVNVYPVVAPWLAGAYAELAGATSGQVVLNTGDTAAALLEAVSEIETRPVVLLPQSDYWARPGEEITFDASASYDADSELDSFEWDFDGDGVIDTTTSHGAVSHAYAGDYEGLIEVRARSRDGGIANAVANVHVNGTGLAELAPDAPTSATAETVGVGESSRQVVVRWTPATTGAPAQAFRVQDTSGSTVAIVDGSRQEVLIPDAPLSGFGVSVIAESATAQSDPVSAQVPPVPNESDPCAAAAGAIVGTDSHDVLVGTRGPDVILAGAGNDVVLAKGGNDIICGGAGRDVILAGSGTDQIHGGEGGDLALGGGGDDAIFGEGGDDLLSGGFGNDDLIGGDGRDRAVDWFGTNRCEAERASCR